MKAAFTPLAPVDAEAAHRFWDAFKSSNGLASSVSFVEAFQFGDHRELADDLIDLVIKGPKRATCGTIAGLEAADAPVPAAGDWWVACDGSGQSRAVIRTTDVRVGPLSSVDDQFAWDEGEGDRSRAWWLQAHTDCFTREYERLGLEMHADISVVFERFELASP